MDQKDYYTIDEVAEHYRTAVATLRYWRHLGQGPRGVRLGTRVLYPASEIRRYDEQLARQLGGGIQADSGTRGGGT